MPQIIIDKNKKVVAHLHNMKLDQASDAYVGNIEYIAIPASLEQLLVKLEEHVEGQVFSCVDQVQSEVDSFDLSISLPDGSEHFICDLYVNRDKECSLRLKKNREGR